MATRSGNEILDALITEWIDLNPDLYGVAGEYIGNLEYMRYKDDRGENDPQNSTSHCLDVAVQFEAFVNGRLQDLNLGGCFDKESENYAWAERDADYTWFGYQDRSEVGHEGDDSHSATLVELGQEIFAVDWTASQYGYREFPMVLKYLAPPDASAGEIIYDQEPTWLREWPELTMDVAVPSI